MATFKTSVLAFKAPTLTSVVSTSSTDSVKTNAAKIKKNEAATSKLRKDMSDAMKTADKKRMDLTASMATQVAAAESKVKELAKQYTNQYKDLIGVNNDQDTRITGCASMAAKNAADIAAFKAATMANMSAMLIHAQSEFNYVMSRLSQLVNRLLKEGMIPVEGGGFMANLENGRVQIADGAVPLSTVMMYLAGHVAEHNVIVNKDLSDVDFKDATALNGYFGSNVSKSLEYGRSEHATDSIALTDGVGAYDWPTGVNIASCQTVEITVGFALGGGSPEAGSLTLLFDLSQAKTDVAIVGKVKAASGYALGTDLVTADNTFELTPTTEGFDLEITSETADVVIGDIAFGSIVSNRVGYIRKQISVESLARMLGMIASSGKKWWFGLAWAIFGEQAISSVFGADAAKMFKVVASDPSIATLP